MKILFYIWRKLAGVWLKAEHWASEWLINQAFWQGARVWNCLIWSNSHNNAQSEKIRKIPHNTEMFTWNFN